MMLKTQDKRISYEELIAQNERMREALAEAGRIAYQFAGKPEQAKMVDWAQKIVRICDAATSEEELAILARVRAKAKAEAFTDFICDVVNSTWERNEIVDAIAEEAKKYRREAGE